MANHESALKRHKQSLKKRERNRTVKGALRTIIKKFNTVLATDTEAAREALVSAEPAINKAASKGIIHKKNASRKVSRLSKKLHKALTSAQA